MKKFILHTPVKVIFGVGEACRAGEEALLYGKNVLLLSYAPRPYLAELIAQLHRSLVAKGAKVVEFFRVQANPRLQQVREGIALCRAESIDVLLAVGGR